MSLKKLLAVPLLISLILFVYFSTAVSDSFSRLLSAIDFTPALMSTLVVAVALQLIGHWIRAKKTALLFGKVKESSARFQFRALSIGYLFNAILPLRIGELIRARIISGAMTISFSYALIMIIFERLIDAMILGTVGLLLILAFVREDQAALVMYALTLLTVGAILLAGIMLLMHQNRWVLRLWHRATAVLNEDLKNSFRFKMWSVIYGLQQTMKKGLLQRYLSLTALSWFFYGASLVLVVQYFLGAFSSGQKAAAAAAPYYGVAVPSGPANLGVFSDIINQFTTFLRPGSAAALSFNLTVWAILVLPIAAIGIVLLFGKTRETLWQTRPKKASRQSIENKLYRQEDISDEMKHFLDNYFAGNTLSKIVHQLELSDGFKLVKYFKGGSDAITILALQNGQEVVKKIIPLEFEDRLKAQYDWLKARNGTPGLVEVLREEHTGDYYAIDLEYDADNEMFYDFLHKNPIDRSYKVMDEVWECLARIVHSKPGKLATYTKDRKMYIDRHIIGCYEKAAAVDADLAKVIAAETIIVNGKEYDNLRQILEKIERHPQAWKDIATYRRTGAVHGDPSIDNVLVSRKTGKVLLIDPAPDGNIMNGPVFDFGKNMQSFYCAYETMFRDESPVHLINGNEIDYRDHASRKYQQMSDYVRNEVAPRYLSEPEQKAIIFHAGALLIRRLKHQVHYAPGTALKYYAVGVKTLNDFLAQYHPTPPTRRTKRKQPVKKAEKRR
jgi:hypothetical protein